MKTGRFHISRPAMISEYLRYIWSRPVAVRIATEATPYLRPPGVPGALSELTKGRRILAADPGFKKSALLMHPAGRFFLSLAIAILLVIIGGRPAQAQANGCPETNVLKYVQFPPTGGAFDVWDSGQWALADDFICTNTGPITDIHLWASWLNDNVDFNSTFWLGIYDDVPAQTNGPAIIPSRPGTNLVWQQFFGPGQYSQSQVAGGVGNFYNPESLGILGNDLKTYYYCFYFINLLVQIGMLTKSKTYWLVVYAMPS